MGVEARNPPPYTYATNLLLRRSLRVAGEARLLMLANSTPSPYYGALRGAKNTVRRRAK